MPKKNSRYPLDYNPSNFNDDGTAKVPVLLWIALIYLSRHLLLVIIAGLNGLQGLKRGGDKISASFDIVSQLSSGPLFLIASIPAFAVLITLFVRLHSKSAVTRKIFTHGRWLAAGSALADIAFMVFQWQSDQAPLNELFLIRVLLDFYAAWYLLRSARVRTTFSHQPTQIDR